MRSFVLLLAVLLLSAPSLNANERETGSGQPPPTESKVKESNSDQQKSAVKSNPLPSEREPQPTQHQLNSTTDENKSQDKTPANDAESKLLTVFNGLLTIFTLLLVYFGYRQARATEVAANAAKDSADASVKAAMPVLAPRIVQTHALHADFPLYNHDVTFDSLIEFVFENYGGTPGIVRQVRADLILTVNDVLPEKIDFDQLPLKHHEIMIPGHTYWDAESPLPGSVVEPRVSRGFTLTHQELVEVWAEAVTGQFRRFCLIGQVIYDDFFGYRYTRNFCLKVRRNGFHSPHGGSKYNSVTSKKIEGNDAE